MKDLETLRSEMIQSFHQFRRSYGDSSVLRQGAWDEYVTHREAFLRADCLAKGIRYIPLRDTIVTGEHYKW